MIHRIVKNFTIRKKAEILFQGRQTSQKYVKTQNRQKNI